MGQSTNLKKLPTCRYKRSVFYLYIYEYVDNFRDW